jgi:predicted SprT family Zn-dependent metalloprotease
MSKNPETYIESLFNVLGISCTTPLGLQDYQKIVHHTQSRLDNTDEVTVLIKDIPAGRGYFDDKKIMLPKWLEGHGRIYGVYYVLHELCHCLVGVKHDETFMTLEEFLLCLWDIRIVRRKVYPKTIICGNKAIHIVFGRY